MSSFVAVDWGTTNRRIYLIENGIVVHSERDDRGISAIAEGGFEAEIDALEARFAGRSILLAGMVGSNRGWVDAGYVAAPATLDALAGKLVRPRAGIAVVPGVSVIEDGRGDVMRGEEVQLLGAVAAGLVPADGLLCQPGTHCKWAWLSEAAISRFVTSMTGELFWLLKDHALIGRDMRGAVGPDAAFTAGVAEAKKGDLLVSLFGARPAILLGLRGVAETASFVSGLVIGTDVHAHVKPGETVYLLADPALGALYGSAIALAGGDARLIDSHEAFAAGIIRIEELAR